MAQNVANQSGEATNWSRHFEWVGWGITGHAQSSLKAISLQCIKNDLRCEVKFLNVVRYIINLLRHFNYEWSGMPKLAQSTWKWWIGNLINQTNYGK